MKPIITYEDFAKLDFRVGTVINCVEKEGSDKLLRLTVDFGMKEHEIFFQELNNGTSQQI